MKVAFIHPDLGLGGAERLIVDAATELAQRGHSVEIHTAFYDPNRCFKETLTEIGGFEVHVSGAWFPRSLFSGCFYAACAYIRCILITLALAWRNWRLPQNSRFDVVVADQVSIVVPLARFLLNVPVLFYCHFPDLLLAPRSGDAGRFSVSKIRTNGSFKHVAKHALRSAYRTVLDFAEEETTGAADLVLANSRFTVGIFRQTFKRLAKRGVAVDVLYPAVHVPIDSVLKEASTAWSSELDSELIQFIQTPISSPSSSSLSQSSSNAHHSTAAAAAAATSPLSPPTVFLSINRYERKKAIPLAIEGLAHLVHSRDDPSHPSPTRSSDHDSDHDESHHLKNDTPKHVLANVKLIVAGGYDIRVMENVEHLKELKELARRLNVADHVYFITSFTDRQRTLLLAAAAAVVYTPPLEHFGIVPLESMAAGKPVLAVAAAGPLESVVDGTTGFLCDPTMESFADAMGRVVEQRWWRHDGEGGEGKERIDDNKEEEEEKQDDSNNGNDDGVEGRKIDGKVIERKRLQKDGDGRSDLETCLDAEDALKKVKNVTNDISHDRNDVMGVAARRHVQANFSREVFGKRFEGHLLGLVEQKRRKKKLTDGGGKSGRKK
uniref:Alpha-1,3/1,6-mannosyltransferase ALG2 n=1 Tax=Polytomella parva TaxID=51329 RepID=A0A7S0YAY3_9CHLO|mmetsp:Transcript_14457/g.25310  ORF Transcript_14457/g.25310 Transcript_14457/m.25310 type:complete len:607 (+) Transcript_14457:174-1994(+)|eukprot:CAMPEP_0175076858 /NCGR_PEP_ID=MMETSP0052_2-20121109/23007_1 /TAXON_ID=51329 ORGANISM="Polytomella parva, Strain SAG 63-3" /NCGR_SAMPLE_ID=MMETSP0052_2 /ASSEMBLY_ACC=CAM_ASM_000194 /LENGTH=606 /DNA_ID=CAMNT_0016346137 /DNA_START=56 /DNA_END=1876 /DNA_ORIENTATION=+